MAQKPSASPLPPAQSPPEIRKWFDPRGWKLWPVNWPAVSALALVGGLIVGFWKFDNVLEIVNMILKGNENVEKSVSEIKLEINKVQDDVSSLKEDMNEVKITIKNMTKEQRKATIPGSDTYNTEPISIPVYGESR